jgi:hypothetical protein
MTFHAKEGYMFSGFFSLPRSLTRDPLWLDLPPAYRDVFVVILDHICFKARRYDDHGVIIDLLPGQICASIREIVKWCGKFGNKNEVERAIKKFISYGFLRQEVRHSKSVLTITHKETYSLILRGGETDSETTLRQLRDNFETQKNNENTEQNENNESLSLKKETNKEKDEKIVRLRSPLSNEEDIEAILAYCELHGMDIPKKDLVSWFKKHTKEKILANLKLLIEKKYQIKNPVTWLQSALIKDYAGQEVLRERNRRFAERLKAELQWVELTILEQYCRDERTGTDFQFNWPEETFQRELTRKFENLKEAGFL